MAKIRISGTEYDLYMGLWAMEQIENEYGDMKEALAAFRKDRKISMVKFMFAALANNGRKRAGLKPDISPDVLGRCTWRPWAAAKPTRTGRTRWPRSMTKKTGKPAGAAGP